MSAADNTRRARRRIIGIHELELRPGVTAEQFEQFIASEFHNQVTPPGWKSSILKCDRGERAGSYALLFEISDVATRDRYFPSADELTEEYQAWLEQRSRSESRFDARFDALVSGVGMRYSDYLVLAEEPGT